jgi:hypothetical protein
MPKKTMLSSIKSSLMRIRPIRELRYAQLANFAEWTTPMADTPVQILYPTNYINRYKSDKRKGQFTGIDKAGRYEYIFASKFKELISPQTVLFDVGASFGLYSLFALKLMPQCQVIAFEPDPFSNWLLRKNNQTYAGHRITINDQKVGANSSSDVIALDDYCNAQGVFPTFVKMDIEGFEIYALQGMKEILKKHKPTLLIEFHHRMIINNLHEDPQVTLNFLSELGYKLHFNGHHFYLGQHDGEIDNEWHAEPSNTINYAVWAQPQ